MINLGTAAQQTAALIESTGLRAYVDGERITLPAAVVSLSAIEFDRLGEDCTVSWAVVLVAADHGASEAWDDLGAMLAKVAGPLRVERADPVTYTSAAHGAELPALQFILETNVT